MQMTLTGSLGTGLDKKELGLRCRQARKQAGLSQREMARLLGYKSSTAIANKEKGLAYPSVLDLGFLSFQSGLSIDWIVSGKDFSKPVGDIFGNHEVLSDIELQWIKQYRILNGHQRERLAFSLLQIKDELEEESNEGA
jgi:transcriptional regulator with XRE-family HTH domain